MTRLFREELEAETKLLASAEHAGKVGVFQGANYDAQAFYRPRDRLHHVHAEQAFPSAACASARLRPSSTGTRHKNETCGAPPARRMVLSIPLL